MAVESTLSFWWRPARPARATATHVFVILARSSLAPVAVKSDCKVLAYRQMGPNASFRHADLAALTAATNDASSTRRQQLAAWVDGCTGTSEQTCSGSGDRRDCAAALRCARLWSQLSRPGCGVGVCDTVAVCASSGFRSSVSSLLYAHVHTGKCQMQQLCLRVSVTTLVVWMSQVCHNHQNTTTETTTAAGGAAASCDAFHTHTQFTNLRNCGFRR